MLLETTTPTGSSFAMAGVDTVLNDPTFSIYNQTFNITGPDGLTQVTLSMDELIQYQNEMNNESISFGTQLGASLVLLLILILVTKQEKRKSWIWCLNVMALLFNSITLGLLCTAQTGGFSNLVNILLDAYQDLSSSDYRNAIAAVVFTVPANFSIMASLVLQVRVVCVAAGSVQKAAITAFCSVLMVLVVSYRIALAVVNIQNILGVTAATNLLAIASGDAISRAVAIAVFSAIFCSKLGMAIRQRRKLGIQQFGAMQIIFIMGCQTMIFPVFGILAYTVGNTVPLMLGAVTTVLTVFLPLSSMWAAADSSDTSLAAKGPCAHRNFLRQQGPASDASTYADKRLMLSSTGGKSDRTASTTSSTGKQEAVSLNAVLSDPLERDLEMQGLSDRVRVDRSFSVTSEQ